MTGKLLWLVVVALVLPACGEKKVTRYEPTFTPDSKDHPARYNGMKHVTHTEEDPTTFSPAAATDVIGALGQRDKNLAAQHAAQQGAKPGTASTVCMKHTIGCKCGCPDGRRGITCTCP